MKTKRIFGDNPVTRQRSESYGGQARGTSHILTTPERIVREHRRAIVLNGLAPYGRPGNHGFVLRLVSLGCGAALVLVGIYMLVWIVIPFLRMLRWG